MGEVPITKYVDVQVTRDTKVITEEGFGTPLILAELSIFSSSERIRSYENLEGVAEDFDTSSYVYKAAQKLFGQELAPQLIKVARKDADVNAKQQIVFNLAATAGTFTITIGSETTASIAYNANAAAIKSALEALTAIAEVTVTVNTASKDFTIEFTGTDANKHFATMTANVAGLTTTTSSTTTVLQYGSAVQTYVQAIASVVELDDDWYFLHAETRTKATILLIAADIEARKKMYFYNTDDADVLTNASDDVGSQLKALGYTRTSGQYNSTASHLFAEAYVGRLAPEDPGVESWFGKSLTGVTQDTTLTTTQRNYAQGKNVNLYLKAGGVGFTDAGVVADGTFIDLVRFTDFLEARIAEAVFRLMATLKKIPYTTRGIGLVDGAMRTVLEAAFNKEKLSEYETYVPKKSEISVNNVAGRILPDIEFTATVTGAIHKVIIRGKLSV